jgi:hypothetical protein
MLFRTGDSGKALNPEVLQDRELLKTEVTPSLSAMKLPERKELKPSRPEELGITVYYEDNKPETQEEWNALMRESYQKNRKEFEQAYSGEFGPSPYDQLDEADLEEIDTNRVRIDAKISEYEKQLKTNPDDKNSKEKLENWRKFKALLIAVYGEKNNVDEIPK